MAMHDEPLPFPAGVPPCRASTPNLDGQRRFPLIGRRPSSVSSSSSPTPPATPTRASPALAPPQSPAQPSTPPPAGLTIRALIKFGPRYWPTTTTFTKPVETSSLLITSARACFGRLEHGCHDLITRRDSSALDPKSGRKPLRFEAHFTSTRAGVPWTTVTYRSYQKLPLDRQAAVMSHGQPTALSELFFAATIEASPGRHLIGTLSIPALRGPKSRHSASLFSTRLTGSTQTTPLQPRLVEGFIWKLSKCIHDALDARKRDFDDSRATCDFLEEVQDSFEDGAVFIDFKLHNCTRINNPDASRSVTSSFPLFQDSDAHDAREFAEQLNKIPLLWFSTRSVCYAPRTIVRCLGQSPVWDRPCSYGKDVTLVMAATKRGHMVLEKTIRSSFRASKSAFSGTSPWSYLTRAHPPSSTRPPAVFAQGSSGLSVPPAEAGIETNETCPETTVSTAPAALPHQPETPVKSMVRNDDLGIEAPLISRESSADLSTITVDNEVGNSTPPSTPSLSDCAVDSPRHSYPTTPPALQAFVGAADEIRVRRDSDTSDQECEDGIASPEVPKENAPVMAKEPRRFGLLGKRLQATTNASDEVANPKETTNDEHIGRTCRAVESRSGSTRGAAGCSGWACKVGGALSCSVINPRLLRMPAQFLPCRMAGLHIVVNLSTKATSILTRRKPQPPLANLLNLPRERFCSRRCCTCNSLGDHGPQRSCSYPYHRILRVPDSIANQDHSPSPFPELDGLKLTGSASSTSLTLWSLHRSPFFSDDFDFGSKGIESPSKYARPSFSRPQTSYGLHRSPSSVLLGPGYEQSVEAQSRPGSSAGFRPRTDSMSSFGGRSRTGSIIG
ncbi:hypothetical protein EV126DRAFT_437342, partial [Verticillium dahliae]